MVKDVSIEIEATLAGDAQAAHRFVVGLRPVVQARVARILLRHRSAALGRDTRQEVDDLTQEVFVALFEDDGRLIRRWSPEGGLSLANFVGLIAQRLANQILTSQRRSPWHEQPVEGQMLERAAGDQASVEASVISRNLLLTILDTLSAELSSQGQQLFTLLLIERRPIPDIMAETGMSRDALYAWRSRLARRARHIHETLMSESASPSQSQDQGNRHDR